MNAFCVSNTSITVITITDSTAAILTTAHARTQTHITLDQKEGKEISEGCLQAKKHCHDLRMTLTVASVH
jgi:hypothetical protein